MMVLYGPPHLNRFRVSHYLENRFFIPPRKYLLSGFRPEKHQVDVKVVIIARHIPNAKFNGIASSGEMQSQTV